MKKKILIFISIALVLVLAFAGCAKDEATSEAPEPQAIYSKQSMDVDMMEEEAGFGRAEDNEVYAEESSATDSGDGELAATPEDLSEKIIYNVYANVSVDDVDASVTAITAKVKALGGYISYANTYKSGGYTYANLELRVPAQKLSQLEDYTLTLGEVNERTMSTENITLNYYDVKGRLDNAMKQEEQLLKVLEKADTVEDILLVRAQLDSVQERIESFKGRIRVWDSLVDYSTVTYNIRPVPTLDTQDDGPRLIKLDETWRAMKRGFRDSAVMIANFFSYLLRFLFNLVTLVVLGIIAAVVAIIVKRSRKHKKEKTQEKE